MVKSFVYILFFIFISAANLLIGQSTPLPHRLFTMQDGLSQMKITSLHKDANGYLWVATRNGLNKFNGETFQQYSTVDGLIHDRIHHIGEKSSGELVLLTYDGISIFNGKEFTNFQKPFIYVDYSFFIDNVDRVWVFEYNTKKIFYFDGESYHLINEKIAVPEKIDKLKYAADENRIYCFTQEGIFYLKNEKEISFEQCWADKAKGFPISGSLTDLPFFRKNTSWDSLVLSKIENCKTEIILVGDFSQPNPQIEIYGQEDVWFNYRGWFLPPGHTVLSNDFVNVNDVERDAQGHLWLGSENGLAQLYSPAFTGFSPAPYPYVWSTIEDKKQNIWMASYGKGIFKLDGGSLPATHFRVIDKNITNFLAASSMDAAGNLYFGTVGGLLKYDGNNFERVFQNAVFSLAYDTLRNHILAGTYNGFIILNKNGIIDTLKQEGGLHGSHYIQAIGIDKNGNYWIGSYSGVSQYIHDKSLFKYFEIENNGVYSIYSDQQGNLWMGGEKGLLFYDFKKDSIISIKSTQLQNIVKSIIDFDENNLLIGAKDGLYVFNSKKYLAEGKIDLKIFNHTNGYTGIEPGFNGIFKDSKGYIWITSATDVQRLDPSKLILSDQRLKANIIRLNGEAVPFKHLHTIFENGFGKADATIEFDAIGTVRPSIVKYQYRMNQKPWSDWQKEQIVVFNDLDAGDYSFQVRAGPTDLEVEESMIDELHFKITLPIYRKTWFIWLASILGVVALGLSIFFFVSRQLERRRYAKQLQEVNYLRSQLLLSELNPHFIFNVLASIQSKIIKGERAEASNYMVKLSQLIRNFLEASHRGNKSPGHLPEHEISLKKELGLICSFVEFEQMKSNQRFDFELVVDQNINPESVSLPPMLLQPFIENAIKHGLLPAVGQGHLLLKIDYIGDELVFTIEDDGVGIGHAPKSEFKTHESLGSKIVQERVGLLNKLGYQISIRTGIRQPKGTTVTIQIKEEI